MITKNDGETKLSILELNLMLILQRDGQSYGMQLMEELRAKAGSLYPMLDRLEKNGLISRESADSDIGGARRKVITLTALSTEALDTSFNQIMKSSGLDSMLQGTVEILQDRSRY